MTQAIPTPSTTLIVGIGSKCRGMRIGWPSARNGRQFSGRTTTYSTLQENDSRFWANPRTTLLSCDWHIVLNDNRNYELIVLSIPANTIQMKDARTKGLLPRSDKPHLIDLSIELDSLVDRRSGYSFSPFVVKRIPY